MSDVRVNFAIEPPAEDENEWFAPPAPLLAGQRFKFNEEYLCHH